MKLGSAAVAQSPHLLTHLTSVLVLNGLRRLPDTLLFLDPLELFPGLAPPLEVLPQSPFFWMPHRTIAIVTSGVTSPSQKTPRQSSSEQTPL